MGISTGELISIINRLVAAESTIWEHGLQIQSRIDVADKQITKIAELEKHGKRSLALINIIESRVEAQMCAMVAKEEAIKSLKACNRRTDVKFEILEEQEGHIEERLKTHDEANGILDKRIAHLESLSLPATDHGKYQKLVDLAKSVMCQIDENMLYKFDIRRDCVNALKELED